MRGHSAPKVVAAVFALAGMLAGCGPREVPPATETIVSGPLELSVSGEGALRSQKPTPLQVPGQSWNARQVVWMLPEGSRVKAGELLARFTAPEGEQMLAQALIELQRNALARAAKEVALEAGQGRVEVDLADVGVQLAIAQRYAEADISAIARNELLDAIEDVEFLQTRQGTLEWQRGQSGVRGGAELAVLDAQRSTHDINARNRRSDLDALELRAPNDGVLLLVANWSGDKPMVGANLHAGSEFGTLPDLSAMEVEIDLPQIEAQGVVKGAVVELHPLGQPEATITTALSWVASAAKVKGRQNPIRYLSMRAPVPAGDVVRLGLLPGQRLVAKVFLTREAETLSVANVAIQSRAGKDLVQVLEAGRFVQREVELGVRGTARSQVISGLQDGDVVLLVQGGAVDAGEGAPEHPGAPDAAAPAPGDAS